MSNENLAFYSCPAGPLQVGQSLQLNANPTLSSHGQGQITPTQTQWLGDVNANGFVDTGTPGTSVFAYKRYRDRNDSKANRQESILCDPYRVGYGRNATGGWDREVVVTNNNADGAGSYRDAIVNAQDGDCITFADNVTSITINNHVDLAASNITIDGEKSDGTHVKIVADNSDITFVRTFRYRGTGNLILRCMEFDGENTLATVVGVGVGENVWLDQIKIHAPNDDGLGLGDPGAGPNSITNLTASRISFTPETTKQILLNQDGATCVDTGSSNPFGIDASDQRRGFITIHSSHFNGRGRAIANAGARVHAFANTWDPSATAYEMMWTAGGGKTIAEHNCFKFLNTLGTTGSPGTRGIFATDGITSPTTAGATGWSQCPQASQIYLDDNWYIDGNGATSTSVPLQHTAEVGTLGSTIEEGSGNWTDAFTPDYDWSDFEQDGITRCEYIEPKPPAIECDEQICSVEVVGLAAPIYTFFLNGVQIQTGPSPTLAADLIPDGIAEITALCDDGLGNVMEFMSTVCKGEGDAGDTIEMTPI